MQNKFHNLVPLRRNIPRLQKIFLLERLFFSLQTNLHHRGSQLLDDVYRHFFMFHVCITWIEWYKGSRCSWKILRVCFSGKHRTFCNRVLRGLSDELVWSWSSACWTLEFYSSRLNFHDLLQQGQFNERFNPEIKQCILKDGSKSSIPKHFASEAELFVQYKEYYDPIDKTNSTIRQGLERRQCSTLMCMRSAWEVSLM